MTAAPNPARLTTAAQIKSAAWGRPMVIISVLASLLGACLTMAFLASYSWLLAFLCAPFGGSALALVTAVAACALSAEQEPSRVSLASPTP